MIASLNDISACLWGCMVGAAAIWSVAIDVNLRNVGRAPGPSIIELGGQAYILRPRQYNLQQFRLHWREFWSHKFLFNVSIFVHQDVWMSEFFSHVIFGKQHFIFCTVCVRSAWSCNIQLFDCASLTCDSACVTSWRFCWWTLATQMWRHCTGLLMLSLRSLFLKNDAQLTCQLEILSALQH